jgi:hypothetical protein
MERLPFDKGLAFNPVPEQAPEQEQYSHEAVLKELLQGEPDGSSHTHYEVEPNKVDQYDSYPAYGMLIALLLIIGYAARYWWRRGKSGEVILPSAVNDTDTQEVEDAINALYEKHPNACRHCQASATNPLFTQGQSEEEECPKCYKRGRDPYDISKKMKKSGDYKISPTYGVDPLYRGYSLPGQVILAMREDEEEVL